MNSYLTFKTVITSSSTPVKPANILITNKENSTAVLTDFGLVNTEGLTPVYCAPESLVKNGTVIGKTDIYSLGVTLVNCFFAKEIVMTILIGTTEHIPDSLVKEVRQNPIVKIVQKMIEFEPENRPTFAKIKDQLTSLLAVPNRIKFDIPNKAMSGQKSLLLSFGTLQIAQQSIQVSAKVHQSLISGTIHDQKESHLCWAFSISTIIRAELKRIIYRLFQAKHISDNLKKKLLKEVDQINKDDRLMFELISLVNPRSGQLKNFSGNRSELQGAKPVSVLGRICFDGLIRPAGWKRLPSIRRVTDLLTGNNGNQVVAIEFEPVYFAHPDSVHAKKFPPIASALEDVVNGESKPTVAAIDGKHAVVLVKTENKEFVFKNSYPNKPWIKIPTRRKPDSPRPNQLRGIGGQSFVHGKFFGLRIRANLKNGIQMQS